MMSIVLFAILGAKLHMDSAYWICYAVFCVLKTCAAIYSAAKEK